MLITAAVIGPYTPACLISDLCVNPPNINSQALRPVAATERQGIPTRDAAWYLIDQLHSAKQARRISAAGQLAALPAFKAGPAKYRELIVQAASALKENLITLGGDIKSGRERAAYIEAIGELGMLCPLGDEVDMAVLLTLREHGIEYTLKKATLTALGKMRFPSALLQDAATDQILANIRDSVHGDVNLQILSIRAMGGLASAGFNEDAGPFLKICSIVAEIAETGNFAFKDTAPGELIANPAVRGEAITQMVHIVDKTSRVFARALSSRKVTDGPGPLAARFYELRKACLVFRSVLFSLAGEENGGTGQELAPSLRTINDRWFTVLLQMDRLDPEYGWSSEARAITDNLERVKDQLKAASSI